MSLAKTVLNLVLSIILGRKMGIMGIGLGTLISTLAAMIILLYHFLSKRNGLHLRFDFEKDDMKKMAILGANDSSMFFLFPILAFVTIKFTLHYRNKSLSHLLQRLRYLHHHKHRYSL